MRANRMAVLAAAVGVLAFQANAKAELIYGLTGDGTNVFTFDSINPTKILTAKFISLQPNENLLTIDARPNGGGLYGVSNQGRLYVITPTTGAATLVGSITGAPGVIDGTSFDSDFNPMTDVLRFGSDTTMNIRISPTTAAVAGTDTAFNYANGAVANIAGLAYSNNTPSAVSTTLYGLDALSNTLVSIASPNTGTLSTIGGVGIDFTDLAGFDISNTGIAYAALQQTNSSISMLYQINLTTGHATPVDQIGGGIEVRDIALASGGGVSAPPVPEPASLGLLVLGGSLLLRRRKV